MVDMSGSHKTYEEIRKRIDEEPTPGMKLADDNIDFERKVLQEPIPPGVGCVDVFGETWDINMILKGNYWGRTIYTTDKICKMFLKWNLERQKKYLMKKHGLEFNYAWLFLLAIGGVVALLVILFVLPSLGV
jgi:hypothetical protein